MDVKYCGTFFSPSVTLLPCLTEWTCNFCDSHLFSSRTNPVKLQNPWGKRGFDNSSDVALGDTIGNILMDSGDERLAERPKRKAQAFFSLLSLSLSLTVAVPLTPPPQLVSSHRLHTHTHTYTHTHMLSLTVTICPPVLQPVLIDISFPWAKTTKRKKWYRSIMNHTHV